MARARTRQTLIRPSRMGSDLDAKGIVVAAIVVAALFAAVWFSSMLFTAAAWVLSLSLGHLLLGVVCGVVGYSIGRRS